MGVLGHLDCTENLKIRSLLGIGSWGSCCAILWGGGRGFSTKVVLGNSSATYFSLVRNLEISIESCKDIRIVIGLRGLQQKGPKSLIGWDPYAAFYRSKLEKQLLGNSNSGSVRRGDVSLRRNVSCTLNSLKGVIWGIILGTTVGLLKGDSRSLDYGSCRSRDGEEVIPLWRGDNMSRNPHSK